MSDCVCVCSMEYGRRNKSAFRIQVEKGKRQRQDVKLLCGPVELNTILV